MAQSTRSSSTKASSASWRLHRRPRAGTGLALRPSKEGTTMIRTTLLELLNTVSDFAETEAELIATVVYLVNSGTVTLCGNFKGARFDLFELDPRACAAWGATMNELATRRVLVGHHLVEMWESPDAPFDTTLPALRHYVVSGSWVTLFNALVLQGTPLQPE
jgi:hypothetical protein